MSCSGPAGLAYLQLVLNLAQAHVSMSVGMDSGMRRQAQRLPLALRAEPTMRNLGPHASARNSARSRGWGSRLDSLRKYQIRNPAAALSETPASRALSALAILVLSNLPLRSRGNRRPCRPRRSPRRSPCRRWKPRPPRPPRPRRKDSPWDRSRRTAGFDLSRLPRAPARASCRWSCRSPSPRSGTAPSRPRSSWIRARTRAAEGWAQAEHHRPSEACGPRTGARACSRRIRRLWKRRRPADAGRRRKSMGLELALHGIGESAALGDDPLDYQLDVDGIVGEVRSRLGESDFWLGLRLAYARAQADFEGSVERHPRRRSRRRRRHARRAGPDAALRLLRQHVHAHARPVERHEHVGLRRCLRGLAGLPALPAGADQALAARRELLPRGARAG